MSKFEIGVGAILCILGLFVLYLVFVWMPVTLYAEAECLRKGYPEHRVTVGLSKYCMNLDGTVTVSVDRLTP
jgi:hypothetical protein